MEEEWEEGLEEGREWDMMVDMEEGWEEGLAGDLVEDWEGEASGWEAEGATF